LYSYAALYERVIGRAARLQRLGVKGGDRVVLLATTSLFHMEAWFAIVVAGGIVVDLNPSLTVAELGEMICVASPKVIVAEAGDLVELSELESPRLIVVVGDELGGDPERYRMVRRCGDDIATICFTGGTTGHPKGACLTHNNHLANAKNYIIALDLQALDSYLHVAPLHHTAGTMNLLAMTWLGATQSFLPKFSPEQFLAAVERYKVSFTLLVPALIHRLLRSRRLTGSYDLLSWKKTIYGTAPLPLGHLQEAMAIFPGEWYQGYGTTETSPLATMLTSSDHREGKWERLTSAGRAMLGVRIEVRGENGRGLAIGEAGEICVAGPTVMAGYWLEDAATSCAFTDDGWYRTGDVGRIDQDGYVTILDRIKDMIIVGGEKVWSAEVERAIGLHADVEEVAVIGLRDTVRGERVHAEVVLRGGATTDPETILKTAARVLAPWKRPRSLSIRSSPLPRTALGKIAKQVVRDEVASGALGTR